MTHEEYEAVAGGLISHAQEIEDAKRPSYTLGSEDVLANFKRVGERTGLTPGQVLSVYLLKHVDSITAALCRPDLPQAEAVKGRFADGLNYLKLGFALWSEEEEAAKSN